MASRRGREEAGTGEVGGGEGNKVPVTSLDDDVFDFMFFRSDSSPYSCTGMHQYSSNATLYVIPNFLLLLSIQLCRCPQSATGCATARRKFPKSEQQGHDGGELLGILPPPRGPPPRPEVRVRALRFLNLSKSASLHGVPGVFVGMWVRLTKKVIVPELVQEATGEVLGLLFHPGAIPAPSLEQYSPS